MHHRTPPGRAPARAAALAAILHLLLLSLLAGCVAPLRPAADGAASGSPPSGSPASGSPASGSPSAELVVFAAASLTDAFDEIAAGFEAAHPGVTVVTNYGGSSGLVTQLLEGGAADVFASANAAQMQKLVDAGLVGESPQDFVSNRLVVIVPAANPAGITSLAGLAAPGVKLVLALPGVPVRDYTDQMVQALAADPAYGAAYAGGFYANLVSEEENVRQVAAKVALGEADAGVVYASDVTPDIGGRVLQLPVADAWNVIANYPIARLAGAPQPALAQEFVDTVLGAEGQSILRRWGFGPAAP